MRSYSLIAPAKINLYLEIIGDRPDGFHELAMVLQSVGLCDHIEMRLLGTDDILVHCSHPGVPTDERNLAHRAASLMKRQFPEVFNRYGGIEITIQKQIPVGAGLAGGSSNAAAVMVGLDLIWKLGLTQTELQELGAKLGSDVPFCLVGGTALATGRGEVLSALPSLENLSLVLAKYRNLEVSTAWAYQTYRQTFGHTYVSDSTTLSDRRQRVHSGPMVKAISHHDYAEIGQRLHNDLEKVVLPVHPRVAKLKEEFMATNPLGVLMSGSGPTVFALATSPDQAQQIYDQVKTRMSDPDLELWITQTISSGIQLAHSN
jgi:4-diphosphocytidyl-2-C-methyl-D-erythritol kinase